MSESSFNWPIVGNQPITDFLQTSLENKNTAQAYLFYGPAHLGKTTVANLFVRSLFCQDANRPCFVCQACRAIENNIHPEVIWLNRLTDEKTSKVKKNITIEQVRGLIQKLNLHSFSDSFKVAVIENANHLSLEAANALLKTLEEPNARTVIILLADNINTLPKTILSRCLKLKFLPVTDQLIEKHLGSLKVETKKAKRLTALAFGRPGLAIDFAASQDLYQDYSELAKEIVGLSAKSLAERFSAVTDFLATKNTQEINQLLNLFEKLWRDALLTKFETVGLVAHSYLNGELTTLAGRYNAKQIVKIIESIKQTKMFLAANVNSKLALENLVLNF